MNHNDTFHHLVADAIRRAAMNLAPNRTTRSRLATLAGHDIYAMCPDTTLSDDLHAIDQRDDINHLKADLLLRERFLQLPIADNAEWVENLLDLVTSPDWKAQPIVTD